MLPVVLFSLLIPALAVDCPGLAITSQPSSTTACMGETVLLNVSATGSGSLTYQWRKDCRPILGATMSQLQIDIASNEDYGDYACVVSDDCGVLTTETATLSPPSLFFTQQPTSVSACLGNSYTLQVAAGGQDTTYQWRKDCWPIPGANSPELVFDMITEDDIGSYDCVISNGCASLTSVAATVTIPYFLEITGQPTGGTLCEGENTTLTVIANGQLAPSYQWYKNGALIPGAISSSLILNNLTSADNGAYRCDVGNFCGILTTEEATLNVIDVFALNQQPQDLWHCPGENAIFTVMANGQGPYQYQWEKEGVPIPGATSSSLVLENIDLPDLGNYRCVVSDSCETLTSDTAALSYHPNCNIPDMALRNFLIDGFWDDGADALIPIDTDGDGFLSEPEVQAVTGIIDCSGQNISDLTGIWTFENLAGLICANNRLERIPNLSSMTHMEELDLSNNRLRSSTLLSGGSLLPPSLVQLHLDFNRLNRLPDLTGLTALERLTASFNFLTDLQAAVDLTTLGSESSHRLRVEYNLLEADSDCNAIETLETRFNASGADFRYDPQQTYGRLADWPGNNQNQITILDLLPNLTLQLACGNPDGP